MINNYMIAENSADCAETATCGLITDIDGGDLMDYADILISDDAADRYITTAIDAGNLTDCADNAAGELIADIYGGD